MMGFRPLVMLAPMMAIVAACSVRPNIGAPQSEASPAIARVQAASIDAGCSIPALPPDPADSGPATNRGFPRFSPVLSMGTRLASVRDPQLKALSPRLPARPPNGLQLQAIIFIPDNDEIETDGTLNPALYLYYAKEIAPDDTVIDMYRKGGAALIEVATAGHDAAQVKSDLGDAATIVKVGPYDAAYVYSSPFPGGFHTHSLYWSDGARDYSLIVNGSGEEVVRTAQSIYCG